MVKRLIFIGAGAGAGEKKYQEPAKNGPAPQHCGTQYKKKTRIHKGTDSNWTRTGI